MGDVLALLLSSGEVLLGGWLNMAVIRNIATSSLA